MAAGESFELWVFTNFGEGDLLSHDWTLVVLGEQELVKIKEIET